MMKIAYLGMGSWGFCLASLLASKGYKISCWTTKAELAKRLNTGGDHPLLPGHRPLGEMSFSTELAKVLEGADFIVESVTSAGLRPVLTKLRNLSIPKRPLVLTSKGIEQNTGIILSEVVVEIFGEEFRPLVGSISGPSYASEVIKGLPTAVVGSAYDPTTMQEVCELFHTETFRVYPNADMKGIAYGGALKNVIAIACGIAEGIGLGYSSRAALMTRGLNEIRKLAKAAGANEATLNGLAGMGDLCLTCSSMISRNYRFGHLIAEGVEIEKAKEKIGMVVEGLYTCVSALQVSKKLNVPMPIAEVVYKIAHEQLKPIEAVKLLMQREIKDELA